MGETTISGQIKWRYEEDGPYGDWKPIPEAKVFVTPWANIFSEEQREEYLIEEGDNGYYKFEIPDSWFINQEDDKLWVRVAVTPDFKYRDRRDVIRRVLISPGDSITDVNFKIEDIKNNPYSKPFHNFLYNFNILKKLIQT